ncbi:TPA: hypothetical protein KNK83_003676 [Clostridioides difficile]|nr:hypothetical protein [Clostridioides difficile]
MQELETKIGTINTKIDTTKTELTSNIETAKTELSNKIGDITTLGTTIKSNTVRAINELVVNLGNKASLTTTKKDNIVNAVNEVKASLDSIQITAERATIEDIDNLFTSSNVEGALKELADKQNELNAEVNGQRTKGITIANNLIDMI